MSLRTLLERDEITVFEQADSQDDMMNTLDVQSARRRKVKCRMVEMDVATKVKHGIALAEKAYLAEFPEDPGLTLAHTAIYRNEVYSVSPATNSGNMGWLWQADLVHNPGLEIAV